MELPDDLDGTTYHTPLECCSGLRSAFRADGLVDGRTFVLVVIQHDLWCCEAPPRSD